MATWLIHYDFFILYFVFLARCAVVVRYIVVDVGGAYDPVANLINTINW